MKTEIIIDSSTDIPEEIRSQVKIVPLTVHFEDREYIDKIELTDLQFYEKLAVCNEIPRTSQPSPAAFEDVYRQVAQNGDCGIVFTVSSRVSGTYQSAVLAAENYADRITVVDTLSGSIGAGILVMRAIQLRDEGRTKQEILHIMESEKNSVCLLGILSTLENLKRSGRISKLKAVAAEALQIKPILGVKDGEIVMKNKTHGLKKGLRLMAEEAEKAGGMDLTRPILLAYSGLSDELARRYAEHIRPVIEPCMEKIRMTMIGSTIGTHLGSGAVLIAFFRRPTPAGV